MKNSAKKIKRFSHIKNLVLVALSDGNLNRYEESFIRVRAKSLNLTENETNYILENHDLVAFSDPEKIGNKILMVYDMVNIMLTDNVINEKELTICKSIAYRMNLMEDVVMMVAKDVIKRRSGYFILRMNNQRAKLIKNTQKSDW